MGRIQGFLAELRRRRVLRAAVAYGVATFGLIQGTEVIVSTLELPRAIQTTVVVASLVGFPVAMVLAWIFDIGPEGIERTEPVLVIRRRGRKGSVLPDGAAAAPGERGTDGEPGWEGPARASRWWAKPRWRSIALAALVIGAFAGWRAWSGSHPPEEPITIAVADFANETQDRELEGLSGLLVTSLEQSRRLQVVTRSRMYDVLREAGHGGFDRIDERLGREAAARTQARALVVATVHRFGDLYTVEMQVVDPKTNVYVATAKEEGTGKAKVPRMIDRLASRVREALHESMRDVRGANRPVASVTTNDLEAWQHYFAGLKILETFGGRTVVASERANFDEGVRELRRAVEIDPGFALAHFQLAYMGEFNEMPLAERQAHVEEAIRGASRLPDRERLLVEAWSAYKGGRMDEAAAIYEKAATRFPQDKRVLYLAASFFHNRPDPERAAAYYRRVLAVDPGWAPALAELAGDLDALGRLDELLAFARDRTRSRPSAEAWTYLSEIHLRRGETEAALSALEEARRLGGGPGDALRSQIYLEAERFPQAEAAARALLSLGQDDRAMLEGTYALVKALSSQGRVRAAREAIASMPPTVRALQPTRPSFWALQLVLLDCDRQRLRTAHAELLSLGAPQLAPSSVFLAWAGELEAAEAARSLAGPWRTLADAVLTWRRGDPAAALPLAERAASTPEQLLVRRWALYFQGEILLDLGRNEEALATLERHRRSRDTQVARGGFAVRGRMAAARALEGLGRHDEAMAELDHAAQVLRHADPDLAVVSELRALQGSLNATRSGADRPRP
jgi:tetratricopeptide (TPR) repeat protein/TolB-like protein